MLSSAKIWGLIRTDMLFLPAAAVAGNRFRENAVVTQNSFSPRRPASRQFACTESTRP
jgi:hypothetical protein